VLIAAGSEQIESLIALRVWRLVRRVALLETSANQFGSLFL